MKCLVRSVFQILLLLVLVGSVLALGRPDNAPTDHKVLLMSDLHFNPFVDKSGKPFLENKNAECDSNISGLLANSSVEEWQRILEPKSKVLSPYGPDTNYALLKSSLDEMQRQASDAALVVITGDLLVHEFRTKFNRCVHGESTDAKFAGFVSKTMKFLASQISSRFSHAQILPVLGNNDSAYGDYKIEPNGAFLADFKSFWEKMISSAPGSTDLENMAVAGYYSAAIRNIPKLRVIVTNTTVWSARYEPTNAGCRNDLEVFQLKWLRSELQKASASHEHVWILGHIPPGIDVYTTLTTLNNDPVLMYKDNCNSDFLAALRDFAPVIQMGFFGHTHNNEFRVLDADTLNIGLQLVPSISPIHGNNPAFMILTVDLDFTPKDYTVYNLKLASQSPQWDKEYNFLEEYGPHAFSGKGLFEISERIADNSELQEHFASYFSSGSWNGGITKLNWRGYRCGLTNLEAAKYSMCMMASGGRNMPGAGNERAIKTSLNSAEVMRAYRFLIAEAEKLPDSSLKTQTLDALQPNTCIRHRIGLTDAVKKAIVQKLRNEKLVDPADTDARLEAGIFPPVLDEQSDCPHLPQPIFAAPGSSFGGHHSYPGGLVVHESNNEISAVNLVKQNIKVYGGGLLKESPKLDIKERLAAVVKLYLEEKPEDLPESGVDLSSTEIRMDLLIAAPIWHDWAKTIVFQWNANGTEFSELKLGGNGVTDNFDASGGDSKTPGHHIIGLAETMKRGLLPEFVITQASAHEEGPTTKNEFQVVNWLRAAAIIARIDPVARGYLDKDDHGRLRLPRLPEWRVEYFLHNLSDADWHYSGQAVESVEAILQKLAPQFGFDPVKVDEYNNEFRNPVLSNLTAEHLWMSYSHKGLEGVKAELDHLCQPGRLKCGGRDNAARN